MTNLFCSARTAATTLALLITAASLSVQASVTPDRTRLIFNESDKSISVTLRNNDPKMPYLAQSWMEDGQGNRISSPLTVLPPVQRIDSMMNGQVKVQGMPDINKLPADRESVFYFNVREIPPKSNKPNTLQIALQTRIKLFWRPKALENVSMKNPWQHKVTLTSVVRSLPSITRRRTSWLSVTPVRRKMAIRQRDFPHGDIAKNLCAVKSQNG